MLATMLAALAAAAAASAATPLPLANSTYVVFNSSVSPVPSRGPVTCYRIPMIASAADGTLVAFAEARIGSFSKDGTKLLHPCVSSCFATFSPNNRRNLGGLG